MIEPGNKTWKEWSKAVDRCINRMAQGKEPELGQLIQSVVRHLQAYGRVRPDLAIILGVAQAVLSCAGVPIIQVTSAYRSPQYQAQLRARWDAGDRTGLVVRPALSSSHTEGRAIDINTRTPAFLFQRDFLVNSGFEWGGNWRTPDRVHFQLPRL